MVMDSFHFWIAFSVDRIWGHKQEMSWDIKLQLILLHRMRKNERLNDGRVPALSQV
jgi:hypothetical protein